VTGVLLAAPVATADDEKGTAVIKGVVKLNAPKPTSKDISMAQDPVCRQAHAGKKVKPQADLVFDDGTLPYVFVHVTKGLTSKYTEKSWPIRKDKNGQEHKDVQIDQKGCMYTPHVQGMMAGQPLRIVNSDPTVHNINARPRNSDGFNFAQNKQGLVAIRKDKQTFNKPEIMVQVKCDVHPWMSAFIGVCDHPFFATTGKGGIFEIKGLPAGTYTLEAWHERWGRVEQTVTVKDGETTEIELAFAEKEKAQAPIRPEPVPALASGASSSRNCCSGSPNDRASD